MVKKIIQTFNFILIVFLIQACVSDVAIELPLQNSIVLNGLIVPESNISVTLHRSGANTDTVAFSPIIDARVTLFEGGTRREELKLMGDGVYMSTLKAKELSTYKIEVETVEGEKAWAETKTPNINLGANIYTPFEIDSLQKKWPFYLTVIDNPEIDNNYWICVLQYFFNPDSTSRRKISYELYTNSTYADKFNVTYDPEGHGRYYFGYSNFIHFSDDMGQGAEINIDFVQQFSSTLKQDSVIVFNMDVHYSQYLKSKMINETSGSYFSETSLPITYQPAFLYTNVHGGMGILGSYTTYTKTYNYN